MTSLYYWALAAAGLFIAARLLFILRRRPALAAAAAILSAAACLVYPALMAAGLSREWSGGWMHLALIASGACFTFVIFFAILVLLRDAAALLLRLFKRLRQLARRRGPEFSLRERRSASGALYAALALIALAGTAIGTYQTQKTPSLRRVEITLSRLPQALDGVRIVQLTDIHLSPLFTHERFEQVIRRAAALAPDFYVVTGDIADGTPQARRRDVMLLTRLQARAPLFMIPGNHDYYVDFGAWRSFYEKAGMPLLENSRASLTLRGLPVTIAGLADRTGVQHGFAGPDIGKALSGASPDALRIALMHRPENPDPQADPKLGVDLQLSGHTHAAQLFFLRPFVSLQNRGHVYGLYECRGMPLYVGSGIGLWSGTPARLLAEPEIVEITLRAAPAGGS